MPYGTIKVDNITFTDNSVDKTVSLSGLIQNPTFTGSVTVTGTISGDVIRGGTTISGVTVTGTTANFVSGVFTTRISGATITGTTVAATTGNYTSLTGVTTTGTTANFVSGVFTTQISGATITGTTVATTTGSFVSLTGTTATFTSGIIASGTAALPSLAILSDPNTGIYSPGADQLAISTSGTGRLFVDSAGKIGIGTTPDTILHTAVSQAGSAAVNIFKAQATNTTDNVITRLDLSAEPALGTASVVRLSAITGNAADSSNMAFNVRNAGTSTEVLRISSVGTTTLTSAASTAPFIAKISSTEVARIDSSGNLGLGVVPSAWGSPQKAIEFSGGSSLSFNTGAPQWYLNSNCYYNGTNWIYKTTAVVNQFVGNAAGGGFIWNNAASGTAGNAITFTQAMTLDTSGRLLVGTTANANGGILQLTSGITFPATAVAASDANTLDDYEEGTWTGTDASGAGLDITVTDGKYTKIGRLVYVNAAYIGYPVTASTANAAIGGLPFTAGSNTGVAALITINVNANRALVVASTTTAFFYSTSSATNSTNVQLSNAAIYGFSAVYAV